MKRFISLGWGWQSTTMLCMASEGELEADAAIFADVQNEPQRVYQWAEHITNKISFPIYHVTRGNLWKAVSTLRTTRDGQRTYLPISIPVYTSNGLGKGQGMRQCTRTYKIEPVIAKARELLGLRRIPNNSGVLCEMLIGISTDEADRMKPAAKPWIRARWPLIEMGMSRADCFVWLQEHGYLNEKFPQPPRSACTFCPFHNDNEWSDMDEAEFSDACVKEYLLQESYAKSTQLTSTPYFHSSRVPLRKVQFARRVEKMSEQQLSLFRNECTGYCGV